VSANGYTHPTRGENDFPLPHPAKERGGMDVAYEAEERKLGRPVALEFLPDDLANDAQALSFQREAKAASFLNHAHTCSPIAMVIKRSLKARSS
jgi:serine/threonine protein kinase